MAGPGLRCVNMAKSLQLAGYSVRIVSTSAVQQIAGLDVRTISAQQRKQFRDEHNWADICIVQALAFDEFPLLRRSPKLIISDAYAPVALETFARLNGITTRFAARQRNNASRILRQQLLFSDALLCANKNQRSYYVGALSALSGLSGRATYPLASHDKVLVIPFGLDAEPPEHRQKVLKGIIPGIEEDSLVVLWSGGIYEWFDLETLIRAFARVKEIAPNIKLFFQGGAHPNPSIPEMPAVRRTKQLAESFGLLGNTVFFSDRWVSLEDRENYLLEADIGITTHYDNLETTFSFRTRTLDYIWAELPIVTTEGDYFAEEVEGNHLGAVVPFEDAEALATAIVDLLTNPIPYMEAKKNLRAVRKEHLWQKATSPLVECLAAGLITPAARRPKIIRSGLIHEPFLTSRPSTIFWRFRVVYEEHGLQGIFSKIWSRFGV
jgi:glycosyltransferase involved in cell wall biosynthesis